MESFLESVAAASSVDKVNFSILRDYLESTQDAEDVKAALSALVDAYGSGSPGCWQQAVMQGIVLVVQQAPPPAEGASALKESPALGTEEYLLLLLFLNDFVSSIVDYHLLASVMELVAVLFERSVPLAFSPSLANALSEEEKESRLALRSELLSLQSALLKRLTTSVSSLRTQPLYQCVLRHLHRLTRALLAPCYDEAKAFTTTVGAQKDTAAEDALEAALVDLVEGLLAPFRAALEHLLSPRTQGSGAAPATASSTTASRVSPLLLSSAFQALEDFLWVCHDAATTSPVGPGPVLTNSFSKTVSQLLLALQQYLSARQRRELEDGAHASPTHDGGNDAAEQAFDLTRSYAAQRAVQRVLSVLHAIEEASEANSAHRFALREALWSGVRAAAAAFGGFVDLTSPFTAPPVPAETDGKEEPSSAVVVVVPCLAVLSGAGLWGADGSGQGLQGAGLDEDELALLGKEAVLRTSFGVVTVTNLVEMVMRSIGRLELVGEAVIQDLHYQGLQQMQYDAGRRAQRDEFERQRKLDQQGVDAIPAGRLLEHVKDAKLIHDKGIQTLRHTAARAVLERAAFSSVLSSYAALQDELESTVREVQAMIAHCLVKLPSTLSDAATDELLDLLRTELQEEKKAKDAADKEGLEKVAGGQVRRHNFALVGRTASYFQLVLQTLFMLYASNAPVRERTAHAFLLTAEAGVHPDELEEAGAGGGVDQALRMTPEFTIDTENPIAFLQEEDPRVPSYQIGKKRPTRDGVAATGAAAGLDMTAEHDEDAFAFLNDTASAPCPYSHFFCRLLELIDTCGLDQLIGEVLLQAPALTRRVWDYFFRHFCLSDTRRRCEWGLLLLRTLAQRRPVYRACAVNILLYMTTNPNGLARRASIQTMRVLIERSAGGDTVWNCVIDAEAEQQLIRYAKRQLAVLPVYQFHHSRTDAEETEEARRARVMDVLNRHLEFFLMLCVRQPRQLFPSLLETFKECVERDRGLVVAALPEIPDLRTMVQGLFKVNPTNFLATMMPPLRRYSRDVPGLVQSLMQAVAEQLKSMCVEAAKASTGGGVLSAPVVTDLRKLTEALLSHLRAMYESSSIPLAHGSADEAVVAPAENAAVLHDTRFLTPFLSFLPAHDLLESYLFSFLTFVQVQLQFQRQHRLQVDTLTAKQRSYVLTIEEHRALIVTTVKEVEANPITAVAAAPEQGPRGLTRTDFFTFLHRAAQESQRRSAAAPAGTALPHIGVSTTREVITVCLDLYSPVEVQEAIRRLVQTPPVPSQLMVTVLLAADVYERNGNNPEFHRFAEQVVLGPLERANTWEHDPQLWHGILLFVEKYYRECSRFLVTLPDSVLVQALRDLPKLRELFMKEHGNNASFGHILANL